MSNYEIRREALAEAIRLHSHTGSGDVLDNAAKFECFLTGQPREITVTVDGEALAEAVQTSSAEREFRPGDLVVVNDKCAYGGWTGTVCRVELDRGPRHVDCRVLHSPRRLRDSTLAVYRRSLTFIEAAS